MNTEEKINKIKSEIIQVLEAHGFTSFGNVKLPTKFILSNIKTDVLTEVEVIDVSEALTIIDNTIEIDNPANALENQVFNSTSSMYLYLKFNFL